MQIIGWWEKVPPSHLNWYYDTNWDGLMRGTSRGFLWAIRQLFKEHWLHPALRFFNFLAVISSCALMAAACKAVQLGDAQSGNEINDKGVDISELDKILSGVWRTIKMLTYLHGVMVTVRFLSLHFSSRIRGISSHLDFIYDHIYSIRSIAYHSYNTVALDEILSIFRGIEDKHAFSEHLRGWVTFMWFFLSMLGMNIVFFRRTVFPPWKDVFNTGDLFISIIWGLPV